MAWFLMVLMASVVAGTQLAHTTDSKGTAAVMALPATGAYSVRINTSNSSCQQYFNAGLAMIYGFNHDEARGLFERALDGARAGGGEPAGQAGAGRWAFGAKAEPHLRAGWGIGIQRRL